MTEIIKETDASIDALEQEQEEEVVPHGEVAIGSYKSHIDTAKRGMFEYGIWWSLTHAVLSMASPNNYHRIDLRDRETLKRMEVDLKLEIDYNAIDAAIIKDPWLIRPNGERDPVDRTKDVNGKPLTKKATKALAKKDKIQGKIDALKAKHKKLKDKKCARALKLKEQISELELKRDRA